MGLILFLFNSEPVQKSYDLTQKYPYLSKRIFAGNTNDVLINFTDLRTQLRTYAATLEPKTGIYFEYLPSGTSIGINEKEAFYPASLLKLPIVIAIYRKIQNGEIKKSDVITLQKEHIDKDSGSLWKKGPGSQITVENAIKYIFYESDNTAKSALLSLLNEEEVEFVFDSVDIGADALTKDTLISPKNMASIFRSLYLSSYLSEQNSNEILELLAYSPYSDRIRAGIPTSIPLAHKYGLATTKGNEIPHFSDCVIVYVPKRPYIMCVMIESDKTQSNIIMKKLAEMTYTYVSKTKVANQY